MFCGGVLVSKQVSLLNRFAVQYNTVQYNINE